MGCIVARAVVGRAQQSRGQYRLGVSFMEHGKHVELNRPQQLYHAVADDRGALGIELEVRLGHRLPAARTLLAANAHQRLLQVPLPQQMMVPDSEEHMPEPPTELNIRP